MGAFIFIMIIGGFAYYNRKIILQNISDPKSKRIVEEAISFLENLFKPEQKRKTLRNVILLLLALYIFGGNKTQTIVIFLAIVGGIAYYYRSAIFKIISPFGKSNSAPNVKPEGGYIQDKWLKQQKSKSTLAEVRDSEPKREIKSTTPAESKIKIEFTDVSPSNEEAKLSTPQKLKHIVKEEATIEPVMEEVKLSRPQESKSIVEEVISFFEGLFKNTHSAQYEKGTRQNRESSERKRDIRSGNYLK